MYQNAKSNNKITEATSFSKPVWPSSRSTINMVAPNREEPKASFSYRVEKLYALEKVRRLGKK